MQKHHDQQQEAHLLQCGHQDSVFRPMTHVHQIDHSPGGIGRVNPLMDGCVDQGNAEGQEAIADETAEEVILFAGAQVHQL